NPAPAPAPEAPAAEVFTPTPAPAPEAPAEPKKKRTGLKIALIAAGALLLLGAAAFAIYSIFFNTPKARFVRAQNQLLDAFNANGVTIEKILKGKADALNKLSTGAVLTADMPNYENNDNLKKVKLDLQFDGKDGELALDGELNYGASSLIKLFLESNDERIGVYSPQLTEEYYTIDNKTLKELTSPKTMEYSEELDSFITTIHDEKVLKYDKVEDLEKAYNALKERYGQLFLDALDNDDFEIERTSYDLDMLGDTVNGSVITYTPNKKRVQKLVQKLAKELEDDEELSNYILSLLSHYLGENTLYVLTSSLIRTQEGFGNGLVPFLNELASELEEGAENVPEILSEAKIKVICVVSGGKTVAEYIKFDGGKIGWEKRGDNTCFFVKEGSEVVTKYTSELKKKGGTYSGEINYTTKSTNRRDDVTTLRINVENYNPKKRSALGIPYGEFDFRYNTEYSSYHYDWDSDDYITSTHSFEGKAKLTVGAADGGGTEHKLKFIEGDFDEELEGATFRLVTTDKPAEISAPSKQPVQIKNENEIQELMEKIEDKLDDIIADISDDFSSSGSAAY
ncbi:MAG: hypothetical protein IK064_00710, partial [Clostridia bacterium]|nr:hypothetical protein [Clostridia bacterium]